MRGKSQPKCGQERASLAGTESSESIEGVIDSGDCRILLILEYSDPIKLEWNGGGGGCDIRSIWEVYSGEISGNYSAQHGQSAAMINVTHVFAELLDR